MWTRYFRRNKPGRNSEILLSKTPEGANPLSFLRPKTRICTKEHANSPLRVDGKAVLLADCTTQDVNTAKRFINR